VVQCGSKRKEGVSLDFKMFCAMLYKRISDDYDVPQFVKDLIVMITSVPEGEWGTKKDPSESVSTNTYRNFAKRGISKKVARAICYRLTPEIFIESLNSRPSEVLKLLAQDLRPYDPNVTTANVAEKLADIFVNIIRETAGIIAPDVLEKKKQLQSSSDLKTRYGKYLLQECENHCVMNGCSKTLVLSNDSNVSEVYEISRIDKTKEPTIDNLIALCPQCFAVYQMDNRKKVTSLLFKRKKALANHMANIGLLSSSQLEKGLTDVIYKITKLNQKDLFGSSLDPKELKEKIDPNNDFHLYLTVKQQVTSYFVKVQEILINLDKSNVIDYEDLQAQMRSIYKKLKKAKRSDMEIFEEISEKLHKLTLQQLIYCQIVVSYFVQKCEVFDAITK
jgi:hypothetical protein